MVTCHVFTVSTTTAAWIVDCGAICHMCKDRKLFDKLETLEELIEVSFHRELVSDSYSTVQQKIGLQICLQKVYL